MWHATSFYVVIASHTAPSLRATQPPSLRATQPRHCEPHSGEAIHLRLARDCRAAKAARNDGFAWRIKLTALALLYEKKKEANRKPGSVEDSHSSGTIVTNRL
jgi:hypothetical protein